MVDADNNGGNGFFIQIIARKAVVKILHQQISYFIFGQARRPLTFQRLRTSRWTP